MSFPRAKIQRFNDVKACSPSPALYSPSIKSLTSSFRIKKSVKSPPQSEIGSVFSANSTPCFRTPTTIPKKRRMLSFMKKSKPVELFKQQDYEALKEKIVECNNKDESIRDLTEQIEEMKIELAHRDATLTLESEETIKELNSKIEELKSQITKRDLDLRLLEEENSKQKEEIDRCMDEKTELKKEQIISLHAMSIRHNCELEKLLRKIHELKMELKVVRSDYTTITLQNEEGLQMILENMALMEKLYKNTVREHKEEMERKEAELKSSRNSAKKMESKIEHILKSNTEQLQELVLDQEDEVEALKRDMIRNKEETVRKKDEEIKALQEKLEEILKTKDTNLEGNEDFMKREAKLIAKYEDLMRAAKEDAEARLKQLEEDYQEANLLSEMQMNEKFRDLEITWQKKLERQQQESNAILKECQAISEYSIIQTEVEKNQICLELEQKREELEKLCLELQELEITNDSLTKLVRDLKKNLEYYQKKSEDIQKRLEEEQSNFKNFTEQVANEKRTYDITMNTTISTIETLKKRLLNSDHDVEQLKIELEECELAKLEYEGKCNQLLDELELISKLNDDLELQHETAITLMESQIHSIQKNLLENLDQYKQNANLEITELKIKLEEKEKSLQAIMDHLHDQQKVNCNAQTVIYSANNELERLEGFNTDYKFKNHRLETTLNKLNMELQLANRTIEELKIAKEAEVEENANLTEEISCLKSKCEEYDDLLKQVDQLQEKYDSYFKYCEYYKNKTLEYEHEIEEIGKINKKYIETCGKYDQLLHDYEGLVGKNKELEQKISTQENTFKPLQELFKSNGLDINEESIENMKNTVDVFKKNQELEKLVKSQSKIIEKLKKDVGFLSSPKKLKHHSKNDKENAPSPNRSLNMSLAESPGPLRDRN